MTQEIKKQCLLASYDCGTWFRSTSKIEKNAVWNAHSRTTSASGGEGAAAYIIHIRRNEKKSKPRQRT